MSALDRAILLFWGVVVLVLFSMLGCLLFLGGLHLFPLVREAGVGVLVLAVLSFVVMLPGLIIGTSLMRLAFASRKELAFRTPDSPLTADPRDLE